MWQDLPHENKALHKLMPTDPPESYHLKYPITTNWQPEGTLQLTYDIRSL